jgi:hypothetical protein
MTDSTLHVIFTSRALNPISYLIRWMMPRSRLALAQSSHSMLVDGEHVIEAHMVYGVRRVPRAVALKGAKIVAERFYEVPDAEAGRAWYRSQVCAYVPQLPAWLPECMRPILSTVVLLFKNNYDFKGALGLGLAPGRDWQDDINWSCYEGVASSIKHAGRDVFADYGHITEQVLFAIKEGI